MVLGSAKAEVKVSARVLGPAKVSVLVMFWESAMLQVKVSVLVMF